MASNMNITARDFHTKPLHSTEFHVLAKWHNSLKGKASLFEFDLAEIANDQSIESKITVKRLALSNLETQQERRTALEAMNRRTAAQNNELIAMPDAARMTSSRASRKSLIRQGEC